VKELRVGILGAGFMGQTHGKNLVQMDGIRLAAICDNGLARAESLKTQLGASDARVFDHFKKMITVTPLDILYVCLPPFAHNGQVEQAASKGIHLFLEKPIAINLERGRSMADTIDKAGVVSQVGFHNRFRASVERFKELTGSGAAGRPTQFQGRYWCNFQGGAWWRDKKGSNGQVFEQVIHIYDMAAYLLGEPANVCAYMDNLCHQDQPDYTVEDTSAAVIRFKNGSMASIVGSNCALPGHFTGDYRAVFEKAVLDYRATGQEWVTPDAATIYQHSNGALTREEFTETRDVYRAETVDFIEAVRHGGATRAPVSAGLASLRLVSAVLQSAEQGGVPVSLS
jgi:predicted dehydrogenase